jgi:hypothetical protein
MYRFSWVSPVRTQGFFSSRIAFTTTVTLVKVSEVVDNVGRWADSIRVLLCCRCLLRNLDYRDSVGWGSFRENSLQNSFWADWLSSCSLKVFPRHLCRVEQLTDLISIGGAFNVLSFSNWLEPRVLRHSMHMSVSLLIDVSLERFAWCVYQLSCIWFCVMSLIPDPLVDS